ncbi:hypothetical protein [Saccharothrix longispora]|uniref:hypothetical protein n=1 Tax=Saccharothrix longispora TaxID=33920 RepID=UPI0028FD6384|nr:hypothetical protein [Saccharothrix longispora]MBY8848264.1 hypothetical protein [Saccharothrix sp. MB29]MDU0289516.1 hypothetical protein [Saccharothrix longispora]
MSARMMLLPVVLAVVFSALAQACSSVAPPPAPPPRIPTILPPTTISRTPQMADRPLPEDCEFVLTVEVLDQKLGRELGGELKQIIGVPEPSLGRTGKIDCYYGLGQRQPIAAAPVIVGLATYVDEPTAAGRVADSVTAEREDGATITPVDVTRHKASLVVTRTERLLVGSLGKTTYVVRAKAGFLPDEQVGPFLVALAQQSMTPVEED